MPSSGLAVRLHGFAFFRAALRGIWLISHWLAAHHVGQSGHFTRTNPLASLFHGVPSSMLDGRSVRRELSADAQGAPNNVFCVATCLRYCFWLLAAWRKWPAGGSPVGLGGAQNALTAHAPWPSLFPSSPTKPGDGMVALFRVRSSLLGEGSRLGAHRARAALAAGVLVSMALVFSMPVPTCAATPPGSSAPKSPLPARPGGDPQLSAEGPVDRPQELLDLARKIKAARAHADAAQEAAAMDEALGWADKSLSESATAAERRRALLAMALAFKGELGDLSHDPRVEQRRKKTSERLLAVSRWMIERQEQDPDLGLVDAEAYYADPDSPQYAPALALSLVDQSARIQEIQRLSGRYSPRDPAMSTQSVAIVQMTKEALALCATPALCRPEERARLTAFAGSFGANSPAGRQMQLERLVILLERWSLQKSHAPTA